jgi:hypothetical protein
MYSIYTERPHLSTKPKLGKCRARLSSSKDRGCVSRLYQTKYRIKSGRAGDSPHGASSSGGWLGSTSVLVPLV